MRKYRKTHCSTCLKASESIEACGRPQAGCPVAFCLPPPRAMCSLNACYRNLFTLSTMLLENIATQPNIGRDITGVVDHLFGVHNELDCLEKKKREIVGTKVSNGSSNKWPKHRRSVAGTSYRNVAKTLVGTQFAHRCWLSKGFAKVAVCLSPQTASPMTHTHAGMHPERPMLTIETLTWDHSPTAHG